MPGIVFALMTSLAAVSMNAADARQARLLVSIVVDGLDNDYLDLLREHFGDGGFRRLEREGAVIVNADFGTSMDATAATAMIMSGAAPSLSGVAADTRYDRNRLRETPVYTDPDVLGNFTSDTYSPAALRVTTVSDEARIASGGTNVVYAVAPKAGQAIGLGGHTANAVLWLDNKTGNWASSTFYQDMPVGIATRNRTSPLQARLDTMTWTPSMAPADYPALPDHLTRYPFRYVFPRGNSARLDMFTASPMINREVTTVALDLLQSMHVGQHDGVTDVLNLAYTLQPYNYGKNPDSRPELMDAYVKLDRNLEQLFKAIDSSIGTGNTVIYLAATPPSGRSRRDDERWAVPYGEFSTRKAASLLNMYLMAVYGNGDYVSAIHNGHIFLNQQLIQEKGLDAHTVRNEAAGFLAKMTGVDRVHTIDDIVAGHAGERAEALRRNTTAATAGDLLLEVAPGFEIVDDYNLAVTDGSTHLVERAAATTAPAFILAPDIAPQTIGTPVDVRALAPTVARILRIRSPNGASVAPLTLERR
ncbi:MAG: hypothetical protein HDS72_03040 [Bacteroidales bacterium]|nr:hypothetical protein [Bacteroidales bacterium]